MQKPSLKSTRIITPRQTREQTEKDSAISERLHKTQLRIISLLVSRFTTASVSYAFERIRLLPLRRQIIQKRMKKIVENVFKRQDYLSKWDAFQNIKRTSLAFEKQEHQRLRGILKKQRGTAIRLLTHFMVGKKRNNFLTVISRLKERAQIMQQKTNYNFRKGVRSMVKIVIKKMSTAFFKVKDSRAIMGQNKKLRNTVKIMKEIRTQNIRWAFVLLRRQMVRDRQEKVQQELKEINQKLNPQEDEELTGLQKRHQDLTGQLQAVKKEREQIQIKLDSQVKGVEEKQKQMKGQLQDLKGKQEQMKKKIEEIDQELKAPFSMQEIYQLCYENMLYTIAQNPSKNFNRDDLLRSLEVPLVPIDLPLDQLKEENEILKSLLSEYVMMYGQKSLPPGSKLQLPYEYLLKQNSLLYKMLMTVLPSAQLLRQQLHKIRQTHEKVELMVKQCKSK